MNKKSTHTVIQIYPKCKKPKWMKKGAKCYCNGEGDEQFIVQDIGKNAAVLLKLNGELQGWESFTKLHQNLLDPYPYQ